MKPLTNARCLNAKPLAKSYKLADGEGMYLEVTPGGGKYWRLKYRFNGKEKKLSIVIYPEVSLADARERRLGARKLLAGGIDPSEAKQEQKRTAILNANNTFETMAREWHDHNKGGRKLPSSRGKLGAKGIPVGSLEFGPSSQYEPNSHETSKFFGRYMVNRGRSNGNCLVGRRTCTDLVHRNR